MSDGCKQILSPFTGRKKRKAWNKIKDKHIPAKRRQNITETNKKHITKRNDQKNFLDSKDRLYNGNEILQS